MFYDTIISPFVNDDIPCHAFADSMATAILLPENMRDPGDLRQNAGDGIRRLHSTWWKAVTRVEKRSRFRLPVLWYFSRTSKNLYLGKPCFFGALVYNFLHVVPCWA